MNFQDTIIGKIYYNLDDLEIDLCRPCREEYTAGQDIVQNLFEEQGINDKRLQSEISTAMSNFAAAGAPFAFRKGFLLGARLMIEIYNDKSGIIPRPLPNVKSHQP